MACFGYINTEERILYNLSEYGQVRTMTFGAETT